MTYATFTASTANFLVVPVADVNYVDALPNIIDDAEQRLYRDLDLLNTIVQDSSQFFTGNQITIPSAFLVVQDINVYTPVGPPTGNSSRNPLLPASKEMIYALFPGTVGSAFPLYFAPITQNTFIVGPFPDRAYYYEVVGTQRPAPLSPSNTTTLLTAYFPDLFLAASLAMGAGYLKDFGAATDDPQSGMSWEKKYTTQLKSAITEEARKKFQDEGWGSLSTGPAATPPRT
jgi:hypothetical protein